MKRGLFKVAIATLLLACAIHSPVRADMSPAGIDALRLKAKSGDLEAMHELGYALQQDADPSNDIEGRDILIRAADGGLRSSAYYLATAYLYGWTSWGRVDNEGNGEEGIRWLRRAGEIAEGNQDQYAKDVYRLLGQIYARADMRGLPYNLPERNVAEATKWFRLCAASDDPYGGRYCRAQLGILLIETPAGEAEGLKWLEGVAAFAEPWSMNRLGDIYSEGKIVQQDLALALAWYDRSAKWTERVGAYNDLALDSEAKAGDLRERLTADQIARGEELAQQFEPQSTP